MGTASRLGLSVPDLQTSLQVHRRKRQTLRSHGKGPLISQTSGCARQQQAHHHRFPQVESRLGWIFSGRRAAKALRSGNHADRLMDARNRDDDGRSLLTFSPVRLDVCVSRLVIEGVGSRCPVCPVKVRIT